jgi:hypothetical protein
MTSAGISPGDRVAAQKQLLTNMAMIISISTALAMLHGDDEDYAKANAHTRSRSVYLGYDMWIPMRQDFFTWLAKSLPEELYLNYTESANVDTRSLRRTLRDGFITAVAFPYLPAAIKPVGEVAANINLFTGRTIESMGMEGKATEEKWTTSTSPLGRAISEAGVWGLDKVNLGDEMLSPVQIDHLIRGFFGLTGASIMIGSRELAKMPGFVETIRDYTGYDIDLIPDVESDALSLKLPGQQWWGKGAKGNNERALMYDLLAVNREWNRKLRDIELGGKQKDLTDPTIRDEYFAERAELIEAHGKVIGSRFKNIKASLAKLRERQTALHERRMSASAKTKRYNEINDALNRLTKNVMRLRKEAGL